MLSRKVLSLTKPKGINRNPSAIILQNCKNLDDLARSGRPKSVSSLAVHQNRKANLVSSTERVSGEHGILQLSVVCCLRELSKSIRCCGIVPWNLKVFWNNNIQNVNRNFFTCRHKITNTVWHCVKTYQPIKIASIITLLQNRVRFKIMTLCPTNVLAISEQKRRNKRGNSETNMAVCLLNKIGHYCRIDPEQRSISIQPISQPIARSTARQTNHPMNHPLHPPTLSLIWCSDPRLTGRQSTTVFPVFAITPLCLCGKFARFYCRPARMRSEAAMT